ncbi:uncharacterized protein LOC123550788 isoform X3 [Mercenaria mercenaria]|uniref:uncharacterized protein LOC123550788 isoform X3 n=1 Tax=Mercenaria mercenaria TaxID=6596 RepID=UPI00234E6A21|nr:uncharacterized protein LOC123550788 isoform X3 [Mercenaria mercenaria]
MASTVIEPRGIPTIFGEVLEKNVTFCIDTSGSMYKGIEMVKEHLIETLQKMGNSGKPYMFNIIEFNSEVTQWSDKLVTCTPQTVSVAKEWINKLQAKTGTNTKEALLTALNDPLCNAVYLVTDGLPDHHPADILEHVASIGDYRPIHCVYLSTEETTESAAIEFLEDLAIESFGSFHIVALTTHGCVERITPIYRSEHASERIIRTINGTVRPNLQKCSVATTLQVDPEESVSLAPRAMYGRVPPFYGPPWGPYWSDWLSTPYRYYYPYAWSRYRPARGWLKSQEQMVESIETSGLSPAAGSLLINKAVIARRLDDGYFYKATVKSQSKFDEKILSDKFLVGFGPCKHGKFTETAYQDTHVFDIIDYEDAKRHTILTGDKVLAPWEPEGERYGPGTVLEGHEKRQAEGPDDKLITVSFTNGKVEKVQADTAVWIPKEVYERLALELKMPKDARVALSTEENYPQQSFEGYPTSGPDATPQEYELADPMFFDYDPMVVERRGPWRYPFHPPYPLIMKTGSEGRRSRTSSREVTEQENENVVPGTDLTQQELDERITSQLMEHKLLLDERETEKGTKKQTVEKPVEKTKPAIRTEVRRLEATEEEIDRELQERLAQRRRELEEEWRLEQEVIQRQLERERLLKREKQEENTLRKSVSFQDEKVREELKLEEVERSAMTEDSGISSASLTGSRSEDLDTYFSDPEDTSKYLREQAVNTDSSLLYKPRSKLVSRRPPWKNYWRVDPAMPITNSSQGPFRETALQAPLEARNLRQSPYINEWTSPVYKFVDPMAKHDYTDSVEKLMRVPSAPLTRQDKAIPRPIPHRPMSADTKEQLRKDFKRRREEQREKAWQMRQRNNDRMSELMQDQHRDRVMAQIQREQDRQIKEQRQIEISREQKKYISKELREKIEANQKREVDREQQRIKSMQRRREHREEVQRQREMQIEETNKRRAEIKAQRSQERWDNVTRRLDQEEAENARRNIQHQDAKINRIQHFQKLEEEGQQRKDVRIGVTDRHLSMFQAVPLC